MECKCYFARGTKIGAYENIQSAYLLFHSLTNSLFHICCSSVSHEFLFASHNVIWHICVYQTCIKENRTWKFVGMGKFSFVLSWLMMDSQSLNLFENGHMNLMITDDEVLWQDKLQLHSRRQLTALHSVGGR